ncbi:MAG: hypothetical protein ACOX6H_02555 [Christensenellales bacterium]|jgi:hypothetical protein
MFFKESIAEASKISNKIVKILLEQKTKYDVLKKIKFENNLLSHISQNQLLIPNEALIHCTSFSKEKLLQIKQEGILSSEFASKVKERYGETYFMADFFKNVCGKSITVKELLSSSNNPRLLRYLPTEDASASGEMLAFIVNTENPAIKKYLKKDLFADDHADLLGFIDEEFCYSLKSRKSMSQYNFKLGQSSIPLGIPYSTLSGIIIDKKIEQNAEKFAFLKQTFGKELLIISATGNILSHPKQHTFEN